MVKRNKNASQYMDEHRYRDVHANQNMERGERNKPKSKVPYMFGVVSLSLLTLFGCHFIGKLGINLLTGIRQYMQNPSNIQLLTQYKWFDLSKPYPLMWDAVTLGATAIVAFITYYHFIMVVWTSNNSSSDHTDINTFEGDSYIMFPDEMVETLDWFPDAGAHSAVSPSSLVSHVMLTNKGLGHQVEVYERYDANVNENGKMHYKGEIKRKNGKPMTKIVDIIDEDFGEDLFTASGIPVQRKDLRRRFRADQISYNPGVKDRKGRLIRKDRDKLSYDTVKDLIKNDWYFPKYEFQLPAGAYLVDTAPVNTMVLAITRAGKGELAQLVA